MYEDIRPIVNLSKECWECLDIIRDVSYANAYTFFWSENLKLVQKGIRSIIPNIKDDLLRFEIQGRTNTFSISDQAIANYRPKIQEFSCFGSAVRMLGAYEEYVQKIVQISYVKISQEIKLFEEKHRRLIQTKVNRKDGFIRYELGRGIDFLNEVFGYTPRPIYKLGLQFFFELRNVTVHQSGIANQRLIDIMNNPYFSGPQLELGNKVQWHITLILQLHHLFTDFLPEVDPIISNCLGLTTNERQAYWYLEKNGSKSKGVT
jgi:hypothetical protein